MKNVYLALAVLGTAIPYLFFAQHIAADGVALLPFLKAVFATPAASGFAADLVISSVAFWVFIFTAGGERPSPWPFVVLNLLVGLSCALPAYLYWQARLDERRSVSASAVG